MGCSRGPASPRTASVDFARPANYLYLTLRAPLHFVVQLITYALSCRPLPFCWRRISVDIIRAL